MPAALGPAFRPASSPRLALSALLVVGGCAPPRPAAGPSPVAPLAARPLAGPDAAVRDPAVRDAADARASALARAVAEQLLATAHLPGLSVAVGRGDTLRYAQGFGYADAEARRPVTPGTRFRAASVSKVVTATALARLVQAGRLDLDAPIERYVPGYVPPSAHPPAPAVPAARSGAEPVTGPPVASRPITARLLAGHLAGVPHYTPADRIERRFYPTVGEALGVFAHAAPVGAPGAAYHYSTHGYTLLSAAMEGAAGRPFLEVLQQEAVAPLGLRATGPDLRDRPDPATAAFYVMQGGAPVRVAEPEDPSYKWAGGGLLTTPADLVRLGAGYFPGARTAAGSGFLRPDVVAAAFASQRLPSGEETGVGLGWRRSTDMDGRRVMEHAGGMEGARSVLALFPAERVAVAVMTNASWSSSIEETAHLLALPFLAPPAPTPQPAGEAAVTVTLAGEGGSDGATVRTVPGRLRLAGGRGTLTFGPTGAAAWTRSCARTARSTSPSNTRAAQDGAARCGGARSGTGRCCGRAPPGPRRSSPSRARSRGGRGETSAA